MLCIWDSGWGAHGFSIPPEPPWHHVAYPNCQGALIFHPPTPVPGSCTHPHLFFHSCPPSPSTCSSRKLRNTPTLSWPGARRSTRTKATMTMSSHAYAPPSTEPSPCGMSPSPLLGLGEGVVCGIKDYSGSWNWPPGMGARVMPPLPRYGNAGHS